MLQLAQAGVAHTKVIEGNPHARFTQRTQQGNNRLRVVYPTAFGDFQYQRARRDTIAREQRQHLLAAIVMQQLQQRHVDRQRQHNPLILPGGKLPAGLFHHPVADRHHQPAGFDTLNQIARQRPAAVRLTLTQQHFRTAHLAAVGIHLRLQPDGKLLVIKRRQNIVLFH